MKTQKTTNKNKERRETNTTRNVYRFGPTMTYSRGKIDLFNQLSMSSLQRDIKKLQEMSFNKLTKKKLNFYLFFPISFQEQKTQWFHSPKVFTNIFLTQENSHQRHPTFKLPPLTSHVSLSWSSAQNMKNEALYSAQILSNVFLDLHTSCNNFTLVHSTILTISRNRVTILSFQTTIFVEAKPPKP